MDLLSVSHTVIAAGSLAASAFSVYLGLKIKNAVQALEIKVIERAQEREDKVRAWAEGNFIHRS